MSAEVTLPAQAVPCTLAMGISSSFRAPTLPEAVAERGAPRMRLLREELPSAHVTLSI
ncbi:MAG: hypothetical protein H0T73_17875 [Ardenticatenales bacterium]|nr:hypothetical protein [Ardenticatenales bacterium]